MEFIEENKSKLVILSILIILTIIFSIISILDNKKTKYVYTVSTKNNSKLPYIDIDSEDIKVINSRLENEFNEMVSYNNKSNMEYEYSINDDLLSLLITKNYIEDDQIPEVDYEVINISISDKKIYSSDDIIDMYSLSKNEITSKIENSLLNEYNEEVTSGYIVPQECNYSCFLEFDKEYKSINDNLEVYVKNDKVFGYLNIKNSSLYYSIDNYPKINRLFELN